MIANVFIYGALLCVAGQLDVPQSPYFRTSGPYFDPPPLMAPPPPAVTETYSVAPAGFATTSSQPAATRGSATGSRPGSVGIVSPSGGVEGTGSSPAPPSSLGNPVPPSPLSGLSTAQLPTLLASVAAAQGPERAVAVAPGSLVAAIDDMTNFSDPAAWWRNLLQLVRQRGSELAINLLAAVTILIVGRWFARVFSKLLGRVAARAKCDTTLAKFGSHLTYAAVLALVVLSALHRIGIDTTSFTAVVAAAGLAVGLALQGSLANFAAGVLLIVFKPFKVGDSVLAGGSTGTIEEIQIFNTLIRTENNAVVIVPNGSITAATITNYSAESTRRIDITLRCSYDNNLLELKRFLLEVLAADDRVLQLPPPVVAIDLLAETGVHVVVQPWVRIEYFAAVRADLLEAIKLGFERHGFRMAGQPKPPPSIRRVAA
ncbi:MAG: mechanosensitive ion channel domain-containing protein [Planctomycetota bacterium]